MSDRAATINAYLESHSVMQGFDHALAQLGNHAWQRRNLDTLGLETGDGTKEVLIARAPYTDPFGAARIMLVGHKPGDSLHYYVWMDKGGDKVEAQAHQVIRAKNGRFYSECNGQRIYNDRFMYDHQARAVASYGKALAGNGTHATSREVTVFATGTGKSYIIAHTLKAMGAHGVVITSPGLGEQMRKDLAEVMPAPACIRTCAEVEGDAAQVARRLLGFKGILVIESDQLERFVGTPTRPGWLVTGERKHVSIDEAHEFTASPHSDAGAKLLARIAAHNDVLAITATPNPELYEALGIEDAEPAISMTMCDAMLRLPERPFRPLALEMVRVGEPRDIRAATAAEREQVQHENEPGMRREALAGYFGRDEYMAPDFYREWGSQPKPRGDNAQRCINAQDTRDMLQSLYSAVPRQHDAARISEMAIVETLERNRIRYAGHKNIAFAVRNELVKNLAQDYQAVHDGTYKDIDALTRDVWLRRAQSAIAAYIQTSRRLDGIGLPEPLELFLRGKRLKILGIRDENMLNIEDAKSYREAVRRIDPEDFRPLMPMLFERIIKTPADIDLAAEARAAAEATASSAALRETAVAQLHISSKEARRLEKEGKLRERLQERGIDTAGIKAAPRYYALAVIGDVPGEEKVFDMATGTQLACSGDDVAGMVRKGEVMHVVNNYRFTTGFSDPDVMMTQRVVENVGDHIVRATQILGRPIREKDGIAAIQEIVGPYINTDIEKGTLGIDRHFSCYDVVDDHYLDRVHAFMQHWRGEGRELWQPSTRLQGTIRAEALAERGAAQGRAR